MFRYLEAVAEVGPEERLTTNQKEPPHHLHAELLSKTRPGNTPKQASRPLVGGAGSTGTHSAQEGNRRLRTSLGLVQSSSNLVFVPVRRPQRARALDGEEHSRVAHSFSSHAPKATGPRQERRAQTSLPGQRRFTNSVNVV